MSEVNSMFQGWTIAQALDRVPSLREQLAAGRLLTWGRRASSDAAFAPITPSCWTGAVKFAGNSKLNRPQAICDGVSFFGLKVYPVLLAPNAAEYLGVNSLKAVFANFVMSDPEVQHLGSLAVERCPEVSELYRNGRRYWGLDLSKLRLAGEPNKFAEKWIRGYRSTPETDAAQSALRCRLAALLRLLQTGLLVGEGDPVRTNDPREILSTIWESDHYSFDSQTGDVVEDRDWGDEEVEYFRFGDGRENYVVRWRAVRIRPPVGDSKGQEIELPALVSKKRKMNKGDKFDCCLEFLKARMSESPKMKPKAKKLYWLDAREYCKAKISRPTFKEAWAAAKKAVPDAAETWGAAGAPKKSGQK